MTIARIRATRAQSQKPGDPQGRRERKLQHNADVEALALRRRNHEFRFTEKKDAVTRWKRSLAREIEDTRDTVTKLDDGLKFAMQTGTQDSYLSIHAIDFMRLGIYYGDAEEALVLLTPPKGLEQMVRSSDPEAALSHISGAETWCGTDIAHARSCLSTAVSALEEETKLGSIIERDERQIGAAPPLEDEEVTKGTTTQ